MFTYFFTPQTPQNGNYKKEKRGNLVTRSHEPRLSHCLHL